MKKFSTIIRIVILVGFISLVLLPTVNFAMRAGGEGGVAKDPHVHKQNMTDCYNRVEQECDT